LVAFGFAELAVNAGEGSSEFMVLGSELGGSLVLPTTKRQ